MHGFNHNEFHRRRSVLDSLNALVTTKSTTESQIQRLIGREPWIFGRQYVGIHARRAWMPLDRHDVPLVCSDRSIHVVELKRPGCPLVKRQRNHLSPSTAVQDAFNQCANYLQTLDEHGAALQTNHRNELGLDFDYRCATGTVIIGHHMHVKTYSPMQIAQTIRSYNARHTRIRVQTYAELIDNAERGMAFDDGILP